MKIRILVGTLISLWLIAMLLQSLGIVGIGSTEIPVSWVAYSFGIAAVQQFNDYGAELYAQFRNFSLDRDVEPNVEDLNVFTVGTRVKF